MPERKRFASFAGHPIVQCKYLGDISDTSTVRQPQRTTYPVAHRYSMDPLSKTVSTKNRQSTRSARTCWQARRVTHGLHTESRVQLHRLCVRRGAWCGLAFKIMSSRRHGGTFLRFGENQARPLTEVLTCTDAQAPVVVLI